MRRSLALGCALLAACTSTTLPPAGATPTVAASAPTSAATPPSATTPPPISTARSPAPSLPPTAAPRPTLDPRTASAIADLEDACAARASGRPVLPLPELVALADGRSAQEFVEVVARSRCVLTTHARGEGPSELALVSNYVDAAVFWVDEGWWRASAQPLMRPTVLDDRMVRGAREVTIGICPCGSGGDIGFAVLRIDGATLTRLVMARPGTSHVAATRLGEDLIHMVGRGGDGRPIAWTANCCAPGSHQWLYQRRDAGFVLVAERQPYDPHYVAGLFFGGLKAGRTDTLGDIASPDALAAAKPVFVTPLDVEPPSGSELYTAAREELMSWGAIPSEFRRAPSSDAVVMTFGLYPPTTGTIQITQRARVQIRRRDTGWYVAMFELVR